MLELLEMATAFVAASGRELAKLVAENDSVWLLCRDPKTGKIHELTLAERDIEPFGEREPIEEPAPPPAPALTPPASPAPPPQPVPPVLRVVPPQRPETPSAKQRAEPPADDIRYQIATTYLVDECLKACTDHAAQVLLRRIRAGPFEPGDDIAILDAYSAARQGDIAPLRELAARMPSVRSVLSV